MTKAYYKFTDYQLEPGGLKKLDFIIDFIQKNFSAGELNILDIGCGYGNIALPLASLGHQIVAIDEDQQAIEGLVAKNNFTNLKSFNTRFEEYGSQIMDHGLRFDVIIMSEFLEHVPDPDKVLQKAKTLSSDNGYLILTIPYGWSLEELSRRLILQIPFLNKLKKNLKKKVIKKEIQTSAQSPHLHFWGLDQIKRMLAANNFKIKKIATYASLAKEFYYLLGRLFIRRGSFVFGWLDKLDEGLSNLLPVKLGSNWIIIVKKND